MIWENDTFALVQRMRAMVYSSKDYESLWFLYQAEGLPKNISIEEFLDEPSGRAERCTKHGVLCKQSGIAERTIQLSTSGTERRIRGSFRSWCLACPQKKRQRLRPKRKKLQRRVTCTILSRILSVIRRTVYQTSTRRYPSASSSRTG